MFLIITDFGDAYEADEISAEEFRAAKDGVLDIFRYSEGVPMRWLNGRWDVLSKWSSAKSGDPE